MEFLINILISAIFTVFSYMSIPFLINIFIKKPLSKKIILIIIIINGFAVHMAISTIIYFVLGTGLTANIAPAYLWSSANYYILKRKSEKIQGVKRLKYEFPKRAIFFIIFLLLIFISSFK